MKTTQLIALLATASTLTAAQAAVTVFNGSRLDWANATSGTITTITFEGLDVGTGAGLALDPSTYASLPGSPLISYLSSPRSNSASKAWVSDANDFLKSVGAIPSSGNNILTANNVYGITEGGPAYEASNGSIRFTFEGGVSAFGLDIIDVDLASSALITGLEIDGQFYSYGGPTGAGGNFFGLTTDAPFSSIILHLASTSAGDSVFADDVAYTMIPSPAPVALGLLGLSLTATRRRK
jgi:hypothetical protein